ncbi:MAG: alpha/beta fold hydrolase [Gemmatimonadota bacterium]
MTEPRKVRTATADGVEIALYQVDPKAGGGVPILLAPGTFSTRLFWLGSRRQGFGYSLGDAGFDPWVVEHRGHGASDRPASWTMDDWVRFDAPAAVSTVLAETGRAGLVWIGHSAGGVVGAAFAGSDHPAAEGMAGLVLLGSPGPGTLGGFRRAGAWLTMGAAAVLPNSHWPGRWIGLGPEREPGRLVRDWMRWNVSGRWDGGDGRDYLASLPDFRSPVLAIAGSGDRVLAPPHAVRDLLNRFGSEDRTLIVAGRQHGFAVDYDHPGLVIGRPARDEIWPRVIEWIRKRKFSHSGESRNPGRVLG